MMLLFDAVSGHGRGSVGRVLVQYVPQLYKPGVAVLACNPSAWEVDAGGSGVQIHP